MTNSGEPRAQMTDTSSIRVPNPAGAPILGDAPRRGGPLNREFLVVAGAFLIILASKLLALHFASSQVPFTDEWDGEAALTIKPYLEGHFGLRALLQPFNEHRIFFTRILTILTFQISGYWDVVLPMIVNAVLHSAVLALLIAALARPLERPNRMVAMIVGCGLAVIPFGHDSTLMGFNTHFYTLMAFSFAAIWLFAVKDAWSAPWFLAVVLATGSFLSMASGDLTPAIGAGIAVVQIVRGSRAGIREWLAVVALIVLSGIFLLLTPHVPDVDDLHAHSIQAFLLGFADLLAWPIRNRIGALLYVPALIFTFSLLRDAPTRNDPRWFNLGVIAWVLVQFTALAFARNETVVSRYLDFCVVGLLSNLIAVLWFAPRLEAFERPRNLGVLVLAVILILTGLSFLNHGRVVKIAAMIARRDGSQVEAANLRTYLATGDFSALAGKKVPEIPYPWPDRLKIKLDDPTIRATLPPVLNPGQKVHPWVETTKALVLGGWWISLAAGALCWVLAFGSASGGIRRPTFGDGSSDKKI